MEEFKVPTVIIPKKKKEESEEEDSEEEDSEGESEEDVRSEVREEVRPVRGEFSIFIQPKYMKILIISSDQYEKMLYLNMADPNDVNFIRETGLMDFYGRTASGRVIEKLTSTGDVRNSSFKAFHETNPALFQQHLIPKPRFSVTLSNIKRIYFELEDDPLHQLLIDLENTEDKLMVFGSGLFDPSKHKSTGVAKATNLYQSSEVVDILTEHRAFFLRFLKTYHPTFYADHLIEFSKAYPKVHFNFDPEPSKGLTDFSARLILAPHVEKIPTRFQILQGDYSSIIIDSDEFNKQLLLNLENPNDVGMIYQSGLFENKAYSLKDVKDILTSRRNDFLKSFDAFPYLRVFYKNHLIPYPSFFDGSNSIFILRKKRERGEGVVEENEPRRMRNTMILRDEEEPATMDGLMDNLDFSPLTYISGVVQWSQSSCHVDSYLIGILFMMSPFYRQNILDVDVTKYSYDSYMDACQRKSIVERTNRPSFSSNYEEYNKKKFLQFVLGVQQSLYSLFEAIKMKEKTSCTVVRQNIAMCLDNSMKHIKYNSYTKEEWNQLIGSLLPSYSKAAVDRFASELTTNLKGVNQNSFVLKNVLSMKVGDADEYGIYDAGIKAAIHNFATSVHQPNNLQLKETLFQMILTKLNEKRKGTVGDPVDLNNFLAILFPTLKMRFKFLHHGHMGTQYASSVDAFTHYCNINSDDVMDAKVLSESKMITFTNMYRKELVFPPASDKDITRPLSLNLILKPEESSSELVEFDLVMVEFLVKTPSDYHKGINNDKGNHYVCTFLGMDGHWYYYNSNAIHSQMNKIILYPHEVVKNTRKVMKPYDNHFPVLFLYAKRV